MSTILKSACVLLLFYAARGGICKRIDGSLCTVFCHIMHNVLLFRCLSLSECLPVCVCKYVNESDYFQQWMARYFVCIYAQNWTMLSVDVSVALEPFKRPTSVVWLESHTHRYRTEADKWGTHPCKWSVYFFSVMTPYGAQQTFTQWNKKKRYRPSEIRD